MKFLQEYAPLTQVPGNKAMTRRRPLAQHVFGGEIGHDRLGEVLPGGVGHVGGYGLFFPFGFVPVGLSNLIKGKHFLPMLTTFRKCPANSPLDLRSEGLHVI